MFGDGRLEGRRAHAAKRGETTCSDEQVASADGTVADEAQEVEGDGAPDEGEVDQVGAGILQDGGPSGTAEDAGDHGEEDEEDDDSAGVDRGDEDAGFERGPFEHVFGVQDDYGNGAHRYAEHGGVYGG